MKNIYYFLFFLILIIFSVTNQLIAQTNNKSLSESTYPYWGEYHKTTVSEIKQAGWIEKDTVVDGWDWSLPDFIEPSPVSKLCIIRSFSLGSKIIDQLPEVNFPANPVISHWVKWRELEPTEGNINFQPLINNIEKASQQGYGSIVRIHFSAIDFAPDWIKNYNIPIREEQKENPIKTNYEVSHPVFHSRYLKFIKALGESGIPQMEHVKGLYLGYASPSNGDEGIGPYGEGNPDANDTVQHVIERIDAWADACKGIEYKVFMGGLSNYGFGKGFGIRRGFVEMYLYHIPDEHIGQKLDNNDYLYVDETSPVIAKNVFQGEENEEYEEKWAEGGSSSRFGALESFPYRYFTANLRLLQMRCNYLLNNEFSLLPKMLSWVSLELGRTIEDTPDAWSFLRESYIKENGGTPVKNFERWLYQRDAPGYETTPVLKIDQAIQMWMVQSGKYYDFVARKGKKIGFHVDDRLFPAGEQKMAIKVSYYDGVAGTLKLVYENEGGIQRDSIVALGEDKIKTATFFINARTDKTSFDHGFDFILESEEEIPVSFVRVIKTENDYKENVQSAYGGVNRNIPGKIEAEHFDDGGEGFAYHDDDSKEGDINFRPGDYVDVVAKSTASNDSVVSFIKEGEWLEYTVDAEVGRYDITLFYFSGETGGDVVLSLDGEILDTINGLGKQGLDVLDSVTVENILLPEGGKDRILRLKFINNASFGIDAIEFTKLFTPVTGVSLLSCPSDTLWAGDTYQLTANVEPWYVNNSTLTWESSDEAIASVDSTGRITAISGGTTAITVTSNEGGYSEKCNVDVKTKVIPVFNVVIGDCPWTILQTGDTHQLSAIVVPGNATNRTVLWSSSNTLVATVDANGLVKTKSQGAVKITLTTNDGGYKTTCNIGVMSTGIPVTDVSITGCPSDSLSVGGIHLLDAIVSPANAGDHNVIWNSSNISVATVDEKGLLTTISSGNTTITSTTNDGNYSANCTVSVFDTTVTKANNIELFQNDIKIYPNPASDELYIARDTDSPANIKIFNINGQMVHELQSSDFSTRINIKDLGVKGMVMVQVISDPQVFMQKVIVK